MFVAGTTDCFAHLPFDQAVEKLADLEFTTIEISMHENGDHLKPSHVAEDLNKAVSICTSTRRLDVSGYFVDIDATGEEYLRQFDAICKLAKATKVVSVTVRASELGTPFNEEVERFKTLVRMAEAHGVKVGVRSEHGRLSADPDTMSVICNHVKGLGLSLDPSHYIYQFPTPRDYDGLLKYVQNVYLRDSTKDKLQIKVGQGMIEYGKLIGQLQKLGYNRALCIDIQPDSQTDHLGELRKLRLLLESSMV